MGKQESISDRSRLYWTKRAAEYASFHEDECSGPARKAYAKALSDCLDALVLQKGKTSSPVALDLGCGSGFITVVLASLGFQTVSLDFSQAMIEEAAATFAKAGIASRLLVSDAQKLDFPDDSFDVVASRNVTWVVPDVSSVYREVMRVLKPGGVFINVDAAYGRAFKAAEDSGAKLAHPTQSAEQLAERNAIARELAISEVDRPGWDLGELIRLGADLVRCDLDFASALGEAGFKREIVADGAGGSARMFALCARKGGARR